MENNKGGWVKLHNKMLENPVVCKDADHLAVWVYLLLEAKWKETPKMFGGKKIVLKPGKLITGRKVIANKLKINESKVQRIIVCLESEHQIERKVNNKASLVTIVNWGKYQVCKNKVNNKRTTNEQQMNTLKDYKTNKTNIKEKIYKKEKYFDNRELNELFIEYLDLRKSMKMINTDRAIKILINKLNPFNDETKMLMLEKAIEKSWKSLYEVAPVKSKQEKRLL